jgi:hypothetical protein
MPNALDCPDLPAPTDTAAAADADGYRACSIKRPRRSKKAMDDIRGSIKAILKADHPMTVRQVFYQLVARGVVDKTEAQYQQTVIRLLVEMRMDGTIPFPWIVDETRRRQVTRTYNNVTEAVQATAEFYRRSALRECPDYLEIWVEKDALSAIVWDAASEYDVPVLVSRGMPSITQLYGTAVAIKQAARAGKHTYIYQFGDHDPSGVAIPKTIERRLGELCESLRVPAPTIERVALTEEQIDEYNLPMRPTKREGNRYAQNFEGDSVELDALPASILRSLIRKTIEQHIDRDALDTLRAAEESEREFIERWAESISQDGAS